MVDSDLGVQSDPAASAVRRPGSRDFRVPWLSWGLMTVIGMFVASSALWVALTPAGEQTELTGQTWNSSRCRTPRSPISSRGS